MEYPAGEYKSNKNINNPFFTEEPDNNYNGGKLLKQKKEVKTPRHFLDMNRKYNAPIFFSLTFRGVRLRFLSFMCSPRVPGI